MPPPVLGFNNNVRHRGRVFHIQTEDSGVKSPRIVTHLFADGGRIIKTARTSYGELIGRGDLSQVVRQMMKDQHKSMFTALRTGDLDELLESSCGPLPLPATVGEQRTEPASEASRKVEPAPMLAVTADSAAPAPPSRPNSAPSSPRSASSLSNPSMYKIPPSVVPPASREAIDLAVGSLQALEPEPGASVPEESEAAMARKSGPAARKARTPAPAATAASASRYGSVSSKPARSIFGDGVISEKSLDEVILSYLAEDLDGPSE